MEVQQRALEPGLKAQSELSLLGSKLLTLPLSSLSYSPLALNLKKTLDYHTSVRRDGSGEGTLPEAGRNSDAGGSWREQWWNTIRPERRGITHLSSSEDTHSQEDGKEVLDVSFFENSFNIILTRLMLGASSFLTL